MGRLSEYINGSRGRSVYLDSAPSRGSGGETITVSGIEAAEGMLGLLMTDDYQMAENLRKVIRMALKEARKNISRDAADAMKSDPRKAARAVKYAVYKKIFGGNVSILQKRKGTGATSNYTMPRTDRMGKRGGNRRKRVDDRRNRLDKYYGADRGFILRFLASGTVERHTRYGNRGRIAQTNWFGHTAPFQVDAAAREVADAINEYIKQVANG